MTIESCRACGATELAPIMSLGAQPLANALVEPEAAPDHDQRFPLDLVLCRSCALVQITETVPPERLFGHYLYFSSYSATMLRHAEALVDQLVAERGLNGSSRVVELASNDGYLLHYFQRAGVDVLGVDPAVNVVAVAHQRGVPTLNAFFDSVVAERVVAARGRADVVLGLNVLAHVADPADFVTGIRRLLAPDGIAVIEVPDVRELVARRAFDTIYHEHLAYFSVTSLRNLLRRHGLEVVRVQPVPVHGGSLRVWAVAGAGARVERSVQAVLAEEASWSVDSPDAYRPLVDGAATVRDDLRDLIDDLRRNGASVAGYGAAAKGTMLLNFCGLGTDRVGFVVDRNAAKHGRLVPGTRQPVMPVAALANARPDYLLVLAWNLVQEVVDQQAAHRRRGGRFIVPVPEPKVL
jgi:SAM-dependent methyltransferase